MRPADGGRRPVDEAASPAPGGAAKRTIRVAASADVHCRENRREQALAAFAGTGEAADLLLLAGDLTTYGRPEEAAVLAQACAPLEIPVLAVLGNHDWHSNRRDEVVAALGKGGIEVLDPGSAVVDVAGTEVGVVGAKGFVGGFPGSHLPDFGEPSLRAVYAETTAEVEALDEGLRRVAHCPVRVVMLHYAPTLETLAGERPEIFAFLGCDRLGAPILEHSPDLVIHGHAHAGTFSGSLGEVEVFNVSVEVTGRPYWLFELTPATAAAPPIH